MLLPQPFGPAMDRCVKQPWAKDTEIPGTEMWSSFTETWRSVFCYWLNPPPSFCAPTDRHPKPGVTGKTVYFNKKADVGRIWVIVNKQKQMGISGKFTYIVNNKKEAEIKIWTGKVSGNTHISGKVESNKETFCQHVQRWSYTTTTTEDCCCQRQNRSMPNHNMVLQWDKSQEIILMQQYPLYQKLSRVADLQTSKHMNKQRRYWWPQIVIFNRNQESTNPEVHKAQQQIAARSQKGVKKSLWKNNGATNWHKHEVSCRSVGHKQMNGKTSK